LAGRTFGVLGRCPKAGMAARRWRSGRRPRGFRRTDAAGQQVVHQAGFEATGNDARKARANSPFDASMGQRPMFLALTNL
jgi:hypothetical protein